MAWSISLTAVARPTVIERLTLGPVRALNLEKRAAEPLLGTLRPGAPGDLVVFDPAARWTVTAAALASKGKNTPLLGTELAGRVLLTLARGAVAYRAEGATVG